jgi:hypothetical protein
VSKEKQVFLTVGAKKKFRTEKEVQAKEKKLGSKKRTESSGRKMLIFQASGAKTSFFRL